MRSEISSFLTPGRQGSGSSKKYLKITRSDRKSTSSSFVEKSWDHTLDLKLGRKIVKLFRYHNFYSKNSKIKILRQSFKNF